MNSLHAPIESRLLDLVSEFGELAKEVLLITDYGHAPFDEPDAWVDEMGDILFAFICLANETGVDLDAALALALSKYQRRLNDNGHAGSS